MMRDPVEPLLRPVALADLRPTQMTVGFAEVARKRKLWRAHVDKDGPDFLGHHMIPAVIGLKNVPWVIDHHHLALALIEEGVVHVFVSIVADLSHLKRTDFLTFMDNRNWLHPYNSKGKRCEYDALPRKIKHITDDPYRSLAGEVRRAGGYAKTDTPYSEFLWADFFRGTFEQKALVRNAETTIAKAIALAHSNKAAHLPGFCGSDS
jgi:hypothetical protein